MFRSSFSWVRRTDYGYSCKTYDMARCYDIQEHLRQILENQKGLVKLPALGFYFSSIVFSPGPRSLNVTPGTNVFSDSSNKSARGFFDCQRGIANVFRCEKRSRVVR